MNKYITLTDESIEKIIDDDKDNSDKERYNEFVKNIKENKKYGKVVSDFRDEIRDKKDSDIVKFSEAINNCLISDDTIKLFYNSVLNLLDNVKIELLSNHWKDCSFNVISFFYKKLLSNTNLYFRIESLINSKLGFKYITIYNIKPEEGKCSIAFYL